MPLDMVEEAVKVFLCTVFAAQLGDNFFSLGGLPMGLVLSCMSLCLNMVMVEHVEKLEKHRDPVFKRKFPFPLDDVKTLRYVDDILFFL